MNNEQLQTFIAAQLPAQTHIEVSGDGNHFDIVVVSDELFSSKSRLQRQQLLNKILKELIQAGTVHAVNYDLRTSLEHNK